MNGEPDHPVQQESGAVIIDLGEQSWTVPTVISIATAQIEINRSGQPGIIGDESTKTEFKFYSELNILTVTWECK